MKTRILAVTAVAVVYAIGISALAMIVIGATSLTKRSAEDVMRNLDNQSVEVRTDHAQSFGNI